MSRRKKTTRMPPVVNFYDEFKRQMPDRPITPEEARQIREYGKRLGIIVDTDFGPTPRQTVPTEER